MKYILITPAYNEENYIRGTIESVIKQKIKPEQWVIVSDGSTDSTDSIIDEYLESHDFITFIKYSNPAKINTSLGKVSKRVVACIEEGLRHVTVTDYNLLGILDSDITFGPDLYAGLIKKFQSNEKLGLAGGLIYNVAGEKKWPCFMSTDNVGGANQLFRRECWDQIGGLYPGGHHDYYAVASCRMHGWEAKSFLDLEIHHHKHASANGRSQIKAKFHLGCMDYVCGEFFLYSLLRAFSLINKKPIVVGCFLRIIGYLYAMGTKKPQQIPLDLKRYLRKKQIEKVYGILKKKQSSS